MIDYFIFHNCISREAYVAEAAARNALVGGRQGAWVLSDFHHSVRYGEIWGDMGRYGEIRQGAWVLSDFHHSVNRKKNTQPEGGMGGRHTPPPHR